MKKLLSEKFDDLFWNSKNKQKGQNKQDKSKNRGLRNGRHNESQQVTFMITTYLFVPHRNTGSHHTLAPIYKSEVQPNDCLDDDYND